MTPIRIARFAVSAVGAGLLAVSPAMAEDFVIELEETVAPGLPELGAGSLGVPGEIDTYTFTAAAGTVVYVDEISGPCNIDWRLDGPSGEVFVDTGLCAGDPGILELVEGGEYVATVFSPNDATGDYSFTFWVVNEDDVFEISLKDVVADGVPGPGAGNIEEPGARDVYTFQGTTGQELYFDELSGGCGIAWMVEAPDGSILFSDNGLCAGDPQEFILEQTGTYTVIVDGENSSVGTYSFTIWEVNPREVFTIGLEETVSDGVPGPGAGNIEEAGAVDIYELTIVAPTSVYVDEVSGGCGISWSMEGPDGTLVYQDNAMCAGDPQIHVLDQIGTYTIIVDGENSNTGTYSFTIWDLNPDDVGTTDLEVETGGTIEEPGARDVWTLEVTKPTSLYVEETSGGCGISWSMEAPDGSVVFTDNALCAGDPQIQVLDQVGTYTIVVDGENSQTGAYSFILWDLNPDDIFDIALAEPVSDGIPGPGAGNIEEPGTRDIYFIQLEAGTEICFYEVSGGCGIAWSVEGPSGVLFTDNAFCTGQPGSFIIPETGLYTILVDGENATTGTYSFRVRENTPADFDMDCDVDFDDLVTLLAAWGTPGGDVDGDDDTDFSDLVALLAAWG